MRDIQNRQGVMHLRIKGKRDEVRFVPMRPSAQRLIEKYLALAGHGQDSPGPVLRTVRNNCTKQLAK